MSDVFLGEFKNAMGFSLPIPSISVEESVSGCLAVVGTLMLKTLYRLLRNN